MEHTPSNRIEYPNEIEVAKELVEWFGYWPSFHDAEVVSIELKRKGLSSIKIHAFEMTSTVNATGQYACTKHVVVNFIFEGITALSLEDFNHQNVMSGLELRRADEAYELMLGGCYGVEGQITASHLNQEFLPAASTSSFHYGEPIELRDLR